MGNQGGYERLRGIFVTASKYEYMFLGYSLPHGRMAYLVTSIEMKLS